MGTAVAVLLLGVLVTVAASSSSISTASRQLVEAVGFTPDDNARVVGEPETAVSLASARSAEALTPALSQDSSKLPPVFPAAVPFVADEEEPAPEPEPASEVPAPAADVDSDSANNQAVAGSGIAATTTTVPTTTVAPTTAPTTTAAPTTTTTAAPTTTVAPPPAPAGNAGHSGSVGCRQGCTTVGFQDLDGQSNVVLENLIISNPGGRCISMQNANNITIRNVTIENCATDAAVYDGYSTGLIRIKDSSNITIENTLIQDMSAEWYSEQRNNAIQIEHSTDIRITNNMFRNINSDISVNGGNADWGNRSIFIRGGSGTNIVIERNTFTNPGRNALQTNGVRGARGFSFSYNVVEGRGPWDSDFEDMINLYSTSGTSGSPILIRGNYMRNGGPSSSGTAIILGDGNDGQGITEHVVVDRNVIMNAGNVGLNIAGGRYFTVTNNIVYGNVNVPVTTAVGLGINQYGYVSVCSDHTITGNRVWMQNQHLPDGTNHIWNPGTCWNTVVDGNVIGDTSLSPAIWNP